MDGKEYFKMTEAYSIALTLDTQEELDRLWDAFIEKGKATQCGWLTDEFGLSWQMMPKLYFDLFSSGDQESIERVNQCVYKSIKLESKELLDAFNHQ